jgi:glucosamine-phosphate N-acetyltransferase
MAYRLRLAKGVAACAVGHLYLRRNSLTFAQADTASDGTAQAKEPPQASADISLNMKFRLRNLEPKDFGRNFLDLLSELTTVSKLSQGWCEQRLAMMRSDALQEMVVVEDLDNGLLCAAGTMVIENKFIHECGRIGHLEDVVVHYGLRAKGLGKRVVDRAVEIAKGHGCYKVLVDCAEKNVAFYEKCGFKRNCVQMCRYFDVEDLPLPEAQPPPAPAGVKAAVELGAFRARPLEPRDKEGFLKLLSQLTTVGDVSEAMFNEQLAKIERRDREHIIVFERLNPADRKAGEPEVLACATLVVEHKFIHGGRCVGHVEDVVVDSSTRGTGLGKMMVGQLTDMALAAGCYKILLNCAEKNIGFYEKCGYVVKEVSMAKYLDH